MPLFEPWNRPSGRTRIISAEIHSAVVSARRLRLGACQLAETLLPKDYPSAQSDRQVLLVFEKKASSLA